MKILRIVLSTVDYWLPPSKKKENGKKLQVENRKEAGYPTTMYRKLFLLSCSNSTKWRKKEGMNGKVNEVKREEIINQAKKFAQLRKNTPASTIQEGFHIGEVSLP